MKINPGKSKAVSFMTAWVKDSPNYSLLDKIIPEILICLVCNCCWLVVCIVVSCLMCICCPVCALLVFFFFLQCWTAS